MADEREFEFGADGRGDRGPGDGRELAQGGPRELDAWAGAHAAHAVHAGGLPEPDEPRVTPARVAFALVMVALALVSFFFVARWASSPETYTATISALDEKKSTVMRLVGASSGASAGISFLPGDAGTPIAEKLMDLSSDFLIVITAIYLEKYLLTILGFVAFKVLIPLACLLAAGGAFARRAGVARQLLFQWAFRLGVFGLAACLVVPSSTFISHMIEETYEESINATISAAEQTTDEIQELSDSVPEQETGVGGVISGLVSSVTGGVSDLAAQANNVLNDFIEALAVMIVTSCVIPILVLLFFLWLVRAILGVDISVPQWVPGPRSLGKRRRG